MQAPPQHNPRKPTPTSISYKTSRPPTLPQYKEAYTYLAAPYEEANVMRFTNKITTSLQINPSNTTDDSAVEQLQNALATLANKRRDKSGQDISLVTINEDPELARQREEANFKEKQKQQRQREKHEQRQRERANRVMARSGMRGPRYGLGVDDIEEGQGGARRPRPRAGARRDWSDEEDYGRGGRTREDEYDEEDDFIAASDEEEIVEDDDDDDDGIVETRRGGSPKRAPDEEEDEEVAVSSSRVKRRRVIDEDDEDE
jgi:RNA polymerase-associated protein LEO1